MAIIHVNLITGDDANDGSTWALAKKTIPVTGENEVRIAKTPDAVSTGVIGTLTQFNKEIVLASPLSKTIDTAEGNLWTSSVNVTGGTYNQNRRYGTSSQQFSILAAFTTGKIAYKTMPLTDFSDYSKISFWLSVSNITYAPNAQLRLCLCSDTTGDVIVNSIPITVINTQTNYMFPIVEDYGGALGNNIQSVAIYNDVDAGSFIIRINNIEAVNNVHHKTLIGISGLNGARWYGIESMVGNSITILNGVTVVSNTRGHSEETGDYLLYYREPLVYTIQHALSFSTPIQLLFGWNTITNEMDGETWLDYLVQYNTYAFHANGIKTIKNVGVFRVGIAILTNSGSITTIENVSAINCVPLNNSAVTIYNGTIDGLRVLNCTGYANNNLVVIDGAHLCKNIEVSNNLDAADWLFYGTLAIKSLATKYENLTVSNNLNGLLIQGNANYLKNVVVGNNYNRQFRVIGGDTVFDNIDFKGGGANNILGLNTVIKNSIDMQLQAPWSTQFNNDFYKVREYNVIDKPTLNRTWINAKLWTWWQTTVKRLGDVGAWQFSITSSDTFSGNEDIRPAITYTEIAVEQDIEVTFAIWICQPSFQDNSFVIRPEVCDVVSEKIIIPIPATGTNIWQLIPITVYPVKTGILVVEVLYKSGNLWVGSIVL